MNRIVFVIIIILVVILCFLGMKLTSMSSDLEASTLLLNDSKREVKVWQDKEGQWRSRTEAADVSAKTLDELIENSKQLQDIQKQFSGLKKSLKNLQNLTNLNTRSLISFETTLSDTTILIHQRENNDSMSIPARVFQWADSANFNNFTGLIIGDHVSGTLSVTDSLDMVTYWERSWFLGKKKYFTEIVSKNPSTKIIYNKSIVVKAKRRRFLGIF